jgi:hypothetical protein
MYYGLNFYKLIFLNLPTFLRKGLRIAWLNYLVKGVRDNYLFFLGFRDNVLLSLSFNSQVFNMERMLNIKFPQGNGQIFIDNVVDNFQLLFVFQEAEGRDPLYIYQDSENKPKYVFQWSEYFGETDFIVYVPMGPQYDLVFMAGLIDFYKFAGRRYKIVFY